MPALVYAPDLDAPLPYGLSPDGRLMHVAEVPSGLACWCRCPGCGAPLVARKGAVVAPHFAHAGNRACTGAWETALHRLAKEVICEVREIMLPEAAAELSSLHESVSAATMFCYDAAEVEVDMAGLRPDAVLHRAGRALSVEFAVTHFCGEAKAAELRRRGLPCIEVDLSGVPRTAARAEHARLILHDAPRRWLYNARIEAAEARLRAAVQARAEAERARRTRRYGAIAEAAIAAWSEPPRAGDPDPKRWAQDADLAELVGVVVSGQEVFAVDAATWQAVLLRLCVLTLGGRSFGADQVLWGLWEERTLKAPFSGPHTWDADLVGYVRERLEDFRSPAEVVAGYCAHLVGCGVLRPASGGWRAEFCWVREVRDRLAAARAARAREAEVLARVTALLTAAGANAALPQDWMRMSLSELGGSPAEIARAGGRAYDTLLRQLGALLRMVGPGSDPVRTGLLGLPLAEINRVRAEQARARDQQRRQRLEAARHWTADPFPSSSAPDVTVAGRATNGAWLDRPVPALVGATGSGRT